jgi:tetratricopeptide (TPR) repeat protein
LLTSLIIDSGVEIGVKMTYRLRDQQDKSAFVLTCTTRLHRLCARSAALLLALAIINLSFSMTARAQNSPESRTQSNQLVAQAEAQIHRAGQSRPMNSKLIYDAIDILHRAVRMDPQNDAAYVDLGFCYGALRDGPTAVDMYQRAVALNPSPANYEELADIFLRVGDPEKALMAANAGLQRDHRNAHLYNAKGMALNDLDRYDEAAEAFQTALDYDPSFTVAKENLSELNSGSSGRGTITRHSNAN